MNRHMAVAGFLVACAALGYFVYNRPAEDALPVAPDPIGSDPVAFTLPDLDGNPHQLSEWAGEARLVNFWATWCAPCRREIPLLKKTQAEHAGNNLQVIGVAVDFVEQVTQYAEAAEFNYPILVGQEAAMAAAEATGIDFIGLPFTMIVSPDGRLINTHIGEIVEDQIRLIIEVFDKLQNGGSCELFGNRANLKDRRRFHLRT